MGKEQLKKMLESVRQKATEAFDRMLETASDEDVKKYENLLKQAKDIEEQLANLEAIEEKEELDGKGVPGEIQKETNKKNKEALDEKTKFVTGLREAVAKGTTFTGLIPREVANEIQRKKEQIARIRGLCTVHQATGDYTVYVEGDTATVTYVGEGAAIGETSPTISPIGLSALKLGALVKVSREFIEDLGVDVMAYLVDVLSKAFAKKEDHDILFGAGTSSSKTALRGISVNQTTNVVTAASTTTVTWEEVKKLIQMLKSYRANATLVCGQAFLDICHSFKDGDTYMFPQQQAITQIMGVRVVVSDEFPALAAGAVAAIVGDFSYYHILDRMGLEVTTLHELYAANDQVGIRALERIDGDIGIKDAFAVLKMKSV